ncbi:hypothetical protein CR513_24822, partial [Mucuna pruriens]
MDKSMIDAVSGGALTDKMPTAARHLIFNMASNTHQFGIRGPNQSRVRLENQLTKLTSLVRQLAIGQHQPALAAKLATWETAISARTESGAICSSTIRIHTEYLSKTNRLSTADSAISSTTFPTATAVEESAYPRQLFISGKPNEAARNQQLRVPAVCELQ